MANSAGGIFTAVPPKPAPTITIVGQRDALAAGTIVSVRSNIPSMLGIATGDQSGVTYGGSGVEPVGEVRKPVDHDVGRGVGYGIRRASGSRLVGSAHKGGAIADAAGRIEVEIGCEHL